MKRMIAGAALVTTLFGTGTVALAETNTTTTITATTATPSASTTTTTAAPTTAVTTTTDTQASSTTAATTTTTAAPAATEPAENALPSVSVTPDKFFYSLKLWIEKIQLAFTADAAAKAMLLEQQAETRLAEAKAMAEAGQADLAKTALDEAKAKLIAAREQIESAAAANTDLSKLGARIEKDQTKFALAVSAILDKAPESVKEKVEPEVADLLVQVVAAQDAATKDAQAAEQAKELAEESEVKADLSALQPRMVLVLNAMARASGKSLPEVLAMYKANPGLGHIAKDLGLKMGAVQHAAQVEWKKVKTGEAAPAAENTAATGAAQTTAPATETAAGVKIEAPISVRLPKAGLEAKINDKFKVEHGHGKDHEKSKGKH